MDVKQLIESDLTFQEGIGDEIRKIWKAARGSYEAPAGPGPVAQAVATRARAPRGGGLGRIARGGAGLLGYGASGLAGVFGVSGRQRGRFAAQDAIAAQQGANPFIQIPPQEFAVQIDEYIQGLSKRIRPAFAWADTLWLGKFASDSYVVVPKRWGERSPHLTIARAVPVPSGQKDAQGNQQMTSNAWQGQSTGDVTTPLATLMSKAKTAGLPASLDAAINELKALFDFLTSTFGDVLPDVRSIESRLSFAVNQWPLLEREYQDAQQAKDSAPELLQRSVESFLLRLSAVSSSIRQAGDELTFWAESAEDVLVDATRRGRNRVTVPKEFWDRLMADTPMFGPSRTPQIIPPLQRDPRTRRSEIQFPDGEEA